MAEIEVDWVPQSTDRVRDALLLIDRNGCTNFTSGRCSDPGEGRARGAKYGADAWCDACIAHDALQVYGIKKSSCARCGQPIQGFPNGTWRHTPGYQVHPCPRASFDG